MAWCTLSFFRRGLLALLVTGCLSAEAAPPSGAAHDRYRWRDPQGNLFYADSIPPEAVKYGYDVLSPQGFVKKHVDRALTPEERGVAEQEKKQAQSAQSLADEQRRQDHLLLTSYPEESALKRTHDAALAQMDQQIQAFENSLTNQERALAEALGSAADSEVSAQPVTTRQRQTVADLQKHIGEQLKTRNRLREERERLATKFEVETAHYRELKSRQAALRPTGEEPDGEQKAGRPASERPPVPPEPEA